MSSKFIKKLGDLKITILLLSLFFVLILETTLSQVKMGIYYAVEHYLRSWFVWGSVKGIPVPVFPGGILIGIGFFINLSCSYVVRLPLKLKNLGLYGIHLGIFVLLFHGAMNVAFTQESQMTLAEGQTKNYSEAFRETEWTFVLKQPNQPDTVTSIPESVFLHETEIKTPDLPIRIEIKAAYQNCDLFSKSQMPNEPSAAINGLGSQLVLKEKTKEVRDNFRNNTAVIAALYEGETKLGEWLFANFLPGAQAIMVSGKEYEVSIRPKRFYTPYTLTLKDFIHEKHPGSDIPKRFASVVSLENTENQEQRDVQIYMNHPLRYQGKTYYQASFAENDTVSILQVVENPGWLLPYIASIMMSFGLLIHFGFRMMQGKK